MGSRFGSIRFLKSAFKLKTASSPSPPVNRSSPLPKPSSSSPSVTRFTLSRVPSELGGVQSMMPLHSAVAAARMTSCLSIASGRSASLLQEMGLSAPR